MKIAKKAAKKNAVHTVSLSRDVIFTINDAKRCFYFICSTSFFAELEFCGQLVSYKPILVSLIEIQWRIKAFKSFYSLFCDQLLIEIDHLRQIIWFGSHESLCTLSCLLLYRRGSQRWRCRRTSPSSRWMLSPAPLSPEPSSSTSALSTFWILWESRHYAEYEWKWI